MTQAMADSTPVTWHTVPTVCMVARPFSERRISVEGQIFNFSLVNTVTQPMSY